MGAMDKKQRVLARVVVVFIAGLLGSVLVSQLIPEIGWAGFLPMGLAVGIIVPDMIAWMRGDV